MSCLKTKLITPAILFLLLSCAAYGQGFIKITTGSIVTDYGDTWGCSWADFNNDGNLDLFLGNTSNDFLYMGTGDSVFLKVLSGTVVNDSLDSRGSTWGDYDGDGDLDLFVSIGTGNNLLYRNDAGTLTKITAGVLVNDGGTSRGCAWGDYDNDGRLDLYVANVGDDFLYHNDGGGNFTKITSSPVVSSAGMTIGCGWIDYNNDGYLDIYAVNFNGLPSFLFRNNGNGTFTKDSASAIVSGIAPSTGSNWGDYDNDGDMDVFIGNANSAGNWLYKNNGAPNYTFTIDSTSIASNDPADSYAGSWVDYDNDGDLDLFVANRSDQNEFLYNNSGYPSYTLTKITAGALVNDSGWSYGSAWGDYDNDGDMDVYICNKTNDRNSLFENTGNSNSWVKIKCKGVTANTSGIGARIRVKAVINGNPVWQTHEIQSQTGYYSQNSLEAEFGFGNAAVLDSLVIKWPGGAAETFTNLAVNKNYTATQGQGIVGISPESQIVPAGYSLSQNYPNPFNPNTSITFELPERQRAALSVYNILGEKITTLVNEELGAGTYTINFNAASMPSGAYFYTLSTPSYTQTRKMLLLK